MKISCLMPTFNRYVKLAHLVEESTESFIRQDYKDKELIICNDAAQQRLQINHPQIKVLNVDKRFETLSDKIQYMIGHSTGDALCRWDDDDISLPHRLSYSANKLLENDLLEWRAANYFYDTGTLEEVFHPGNTHVMSLWKREILKYSPFNGKYPPKRSGDEDQLFNTYLNQLDRTKCEVIPTKDIYYLYRWATGSRHLSGMGGGDMLQLHYDKIGHNAIDVGWWGIDARWHENHIARVQQKLRLPRPLEVKDEIGNYFDYERLYSSIIENVPNGGKIVEVGCLYGASLIYLAKAAKKASKRLQIVGVDLGIGVGDSSGNFQQDFHDTQTLLTNIFSEGIHENTTVMMGESSRVAANFADNSIDAIFLDDAHDYQSVKANLQAWVRKVKKGGTISGHDYNHSYYPGVKQAVNEYFGKDCQSSYCESCWQVVRS